MRARAMQCRKFLCGNNTLNGVQITPRPVAELSALI